MTAPTVVTALALSLAAVPGAGAADGGYRLDRTWAVVTGVEDIGGVAAAANGRIHVVAETTDFDPRSVVRTYTAAGVLKSSWDVPVQVPTGLAVDPTGNLHVADYVGDPGSGVPSQVRVFSPAGTPVRSYRSEVDSAPSDVAVDRNGTAYVADPGNDQIHVFNAAGVQLRSFGGSGSAPGRLHRPWGVAVAANGTVYVADSGNHRIQQFRADGRLVRAWGQAGNGPGQFRSPSRIEIAPNGNVFVVDAPARVLEFTPTGRFVGVAAKAGLRDSQDLAFDRSGALYVGGVLASQRRGIARFVRAPLTSKANIRGTKVKKVKGKPRVRMQVRCRGQVRCKGTVRIKRKGVLAKGTFAVPAGRTKRVSIKLTRKGKKRLARRKAVKAVAIVKMPKVAKVRKKVALRR